MLPAMVAERDDAQLMTGYAAGDVAAFESLYARHKGPLFRYFFRQCGDPETAAELFQEVWVRIIKARERVEPKARFTTYLYQIAHNCLVDYFRKAGLSLMGFTGAPASEAVPDPIVEELDPAFASARWSLVDWQKEAADASSGPEAATSGVQRAERLRAALDVLPLEQHEAFLLHEEAEMGLADIAAVTGTDAETVMTRLRYAVKKLRAALGDPAPAAPRGARS